MANTNGEGTGQAPASDGPDHIRGTNGSNVIHGGGGNDNVGGGAGADRVYGDHGDDGISGGQGNDFIVGGAGDDRIYGGKGDDTVLYHGKIEDYSIYMDRQGRLHIDDHVAGRDGHDMLQTVEYFQFGNHTYSLADLGALGILHV